MKCGVFGEGGQDEEVALEAVEVGGGEDEGLGEVWGEGDGEGAGVGVRREGGVGHGGVFDLEGVKRGERGVEWCGGWGLGHDVVVVDVCVVGVRVE